MKTVIIGLVRSVGGWLALAATLSYALQTEYGQRPADTIGVALLAGGIAWAAVGLIISSARQWRERAAIQSGVAGVRPSDGARAVLVGTIEPTGPVLRAPLDGSPCVTYSYEILDDRGTGRHRYIIPVARGVALTPSMIVTATGSYKLLVVPDLEATESGDSKDERIAHFLRYARETTFAERKVAAKELLQRWSDADGSYRSDIAYGPLEGVDTTYWVPTQRHVPVGVRVCVFGPYSEAKGGIVPSATRPVRLMRGSGEQVAASLRSTMISRAVLGLVLGAAATGLVLMFLSWSLEA